MKISNKISLLVVFLWLILGLTTLIGLGRINKIGSVLDDLVTQDMVLNDIASTITRHQLEKTLFFERSARVAEELAFSKVSPARREYLLDHVRLVQRDFKQAAQRGAFKILEGLALVRQGQQNVHIDDYQSQRLRQTERILTRIEEAHIEYDKTVGHIFEMVLQGDYELSIEDIRKIQFRESALKRELDQMIHNIEEYVMTSLKHASAVEDVARQVLWFQFVLSIVIGGMFAFSIVRSFSRSLRDLERAALAVGQGDFSVKLNSKSKDEVGQVSHAFNTMSRQLLELTSELENKNQMLAENLQLTSEQKQNLEKVNRELDQFVYTVSHDIRSPLMGIAWYSDFLRKHGEKLDQKSKNCVDGICKGVDRLSHLIDDLLALTRILRIQNPYEWASLSDMLDTVLDRLEFSIRESQVRIVRPETLPMIVCDRIKLTEVLFNLISNGIKFSAQQGKPPQVEIGYRDDGEAHELFVKDNGIGIDPQFHSEVFDIFKRLDTTGEYDGTGTGLCIVQGVIEAHGGRIWIDSKLGQGSTFFFTIPKSLSVDSEASPS